MPTLQDKFGKGLVIHLKGEQITNTILGAPEHEIDVFNDAIWKVIEASLENPTKAGISVSAWFGLKELQKSNPVTIQTEPNGNLSYSRVQFYIKREIADNVVYFE